MSQVLNTYLYTNDPRATNFGGTFVLVSRLTLYHMLSSGRIRQLLQLSLPTPRNGTSNAQEEPSRRRVLITAKWW